MGELTPPLLFHIAMRHFKQVIILSDKVSASIFNLPCIQSIEKNNTGAPVYCFKETMRSPRGIVAHSLRPGEIIAEDYDGKWCWLTEYDYQTYLKQCQHLEKAIQNHNAQCPKLKS